MTCTDCGDTIPENREAAIRKYGLAPLCCACVVASRDRVVTVKDVNPEVLAESEIEHHQVMRWEQA